MSTPSLRPVPHACAEFEADLSMLADGELRGLDADRVARHVESCAGCRGLVENLSQLVDLHRSMDARESSAESPAEASELDAVLSGFDGSAMWSELAQRLVSDTEDRLVKVLYELGKALIAAGYETSPEYRNQVVYEKAPGSISSLTRKGRQLLREREGLDRNQDLGRTVDGASKVAAGRRERERERGRRGLGRGRGDLFSLQVRARGPVAFESGRRCLEECLRLSPEHAGARIFLGVYHRKVGRLDLARRQFQSVRRSAAQASDRLIASHQLARVYSEACQFARALEMEAQNLEAARELGHRMIQVASLANMMIYSVKLERFEEADQILERLVREFPDQLDNVVAPAFQKARYFRIALLKNAEFLERLRVRYPSLFAA